MSPHALALSRMLAEELHRSGATLAEATAAISDAYIATTLARSDRNVTRAAHRLGIHRNTLHLWLRTRERTA